MKSKNIGCTAVEYLITLIVFACVAVFSLANMHYQSTHTEIKATDYQKPDSIASQAGKAAAARIVSPKKEK